METTTFANREAIEDFVDEAINSLGGLPASLDAYRLNPAESEPIHAVFRAVHSIKGCAAFLDLDAIRGFSHSLENTLDAVRNGQVTLSEELSQAFVAGFDLLDGMLQEVAEGTVATELRPQEQQLLDRVRKLAAQASAERTPEELLCEQLLALSEDVSVGHVSEPREWAKRLRSLVTRYASDNSAQPEQSTDESAKLTPADLVTACCVCGGIDVTDRVRSIAEALLACEDESHGEQAETALLGSIQSLATWAADAGQPNLAESLAAAAGDLKTILDNPMDLDANLLSVIWDQLSPELGKLQVRATDAAEQSAGDTADGNGGPAKPPAATAQKQAAKSRFVRVKQEHLDEFLEHVSRLLITAELFKDVQSRIAETGQLPELAEEIRQVNADLRVESMALQQGVMALRRVSISGLFSKFPRMARTLASNLGKKIAVHTSGEETEIDKTLAEDLDAPLTHLIRNVVDHGIELPEERTARGVSETGNLWLSARQTKNHVQITVRDDGRGIDPDRLRAKAVEKGVLSQAQAEALPDREALNLIFHPGFSTAEKVSEVSGRGVGMDVVRTTLEKQDGEVSVESQIGVGTTLRLDIPIRQATLVIDGLMVAESGGQFAIPFENIREIVEVAPDQLHSAHGRRMVKIREEVYDAIRLGEVLNLPPADPDEAKRTPGILVHAKDSSFCLLVDRVLGHRQVVVSSLRETLPDADKMAGVAQLGGGRLALVLSIAEVIKGVR